MDVDNSWLGKQFGQYKVVKFLGKGGFSRVYLGRHISLATEAAIKLLSVPFSAKDKEMFEAEALRHAHLRHPHIIRVLDMGIEEEAPFLVMDYAPQGSILQLHPRGTRIELQTIGNYVLQIADALQYAHHLNLVHCDVKPANILVGQNNELLLSDFGLTVFSQSVRGDSQSVHIPMGTPAYMAPEQFEGKPRRSSDQYALAVMVYEWICGQLPFQGDNEEMRYQHCKVQPASLRRITPSLPSAVDVVVLQALAKEPTSRFASVRDFALALEQSISPTPLGEITLPVVNTETFMQKIANALSSPKIFPFLPNLREIDNLIIRFLCEEVITGNSYWINIERPIIKAETLDINQDQFIEILKMLQSLGLLEMEDVLGTPISLIKIKTHTFEKYAQLYIPGYRETKRTCIVQMLQKRIFLNKDLALPLAQPLMICNHILHFLADRGFIDIKETIGNRIEVQSIAAELTRLVRDGDVEKIL